MSTKFVCFINPHTNKPILVNPAHVRTASEVDPQKVALVTARGRSRPDEIRIYCLRPVAASPVLKRPPCRFDARPPRPSSHALANMTALSAASASRNRTPSTLAVRRASASGRASRVLAPCPQKAQPSMRSGETEKDSIARNDDSKGSKPRGAVTRRVRRSQNSTTGQTGVDEARPIDMGHLSEHDRVRQSLRIDP
jgi:hypothetical protein